MTGSLQYLIEADELRTAHHSPLPLTSHPLPLAASPSAPPIRDSKFAIRNQDASSVSSVVKARFPGAIIDGVSFVDCIFRGVRSTEVVEASGSILFRNVKIEPAEKAEV